MPPAHSNFRSRESRPRRLRTAAYALVACLVASVAVAAPRPPNFLLIVADDLGYSDLGAFGGEIRTPTLDRLAREGLRFSSFYSAPTCSPSRAMLLTSVDAHKAGMGNMAEDLAANQQGHDEYLGHLNSHVATMAERLHDAGYATFMAGKWHLGGAAPDLPGARGFEHYFALMQGGASHYDMSGPSAESPRARYVRDGDPIDQLPKDFYSTDYYATQIKTYLAAEHGRRPFFAYLAFTAPHWPLQAPEALIRRYLPVYRDGPAALRARRLAGLEREGLIAPGTQAHAFVPEAQAWSALDAETRARDVRRMATFAAMVDRLDTDVGSVLDALRRSGELDRTVVVFLSDNGAEGHDLAALPDFHDWVMHFDQRTARIGRPGSFAWYGPQWAQAATAPSRLHKGFPTEGGIHVPAFIWAHDLAAHGINRSLVSIMDIGPTLLDLAGVAHDGSEFHDHDVHAIEGRSLQAVLAGRSDHVRGDSDTLGWELFGRSGIRSGTWKAIQLGQHADDRRWELYDLATDPAETRDLSASEPRRAADMQALWQRYVEENHVILPDTVTGY